MNKSMESQTFPRSIHRKFTASKTFLAALINNLDRQTKL